MRSARRKPTVSTSMRESQGGATSPGWLGSGVGFEFGFGFGFWYRSRSSLVAGLGLALRLGLGSGLGLGLGLGSALGLTDLRFVEADAVLALD